MNQIVANVVINTSKNRMLTQLCGIDYENE